LEKPDGKRPCGKLKRKRKDNIKMDFKEWDGVMDRVHLAEDRDRWLALVNAVMSRRAP